MAGLGSGSYSLGNNVRQNKSYVHMRLTDLAFKAFEDYTRIKNTVGSPRISFRGNDGEIQIPNRSGGVSKFSFSLQSIQEDGPQGSFEFIKQVGTRTLESLGPMLGKIFIQAGDDTYQTTRQRMENVKVQNAMNCVKEVKSNSNSPYVRQRPSFMKKTSTLVVPPPKKEVTAELPSNNRYNHNTSNSPHRTHSGGTIPPPVKPPPPPPPSNPNGKKSNPVLLKKPLKERIIHLLAVRNYRKPEMLSRLYSDGIQEKDKRQLTSVLNSVSQLKDNVHLLSRHLWSEVREDWPFYTDAERQLVKSKKPQSLTPPSNDNSHSPNTALPSSPSSGAQGIKRPNEEVFDPTAKRPRWNATKSNKRKTEDKIESHSASRLDPHDTKSDSMSGSRSENKTVSNGRHHYEDENPRLNGSISSASKSSSITSTSPINQRSPRHRPNGINTHQSSGNHSPINGITNGLTNGHGHPPHRTNGHARVESSIPNSSPDSHHGDDDGNPEYLRTYTAIVSSDQRSRYKADFNVQYEEYLRLHSYIEERTRPFNELEERLHNETVGTDEYNTIRTQIFNVYQAAQQDSEYQQKKQRFDYLHEKLTHIKNLVREYDTTHS